MEGIERRIDDRSSWISRIVYNDICRIRFQKDLEIDRGVGELLLRS